MPLIVAKNEALRSKSEGFLLRNRGFIILVYLSLKELREGEWY
jgi:DNA-directed RNA polymerase subunit E'/Rpb7